MFIGGGSAATAGGIKITTFPVLGFAICNEIWGLEQVTIGHRSINPASGSEARIACRKASSDGRPVTPADV